MEVLFNVPIKPNVLYLRGDISEEAPSVLQNGAVCNTNTYFGCFPCEPYHEYTSVTEVQACIRISGKGYVRLRHVTNKGSVILDEVITELPYKSVTAKEKCIPFNLEEYPEGYIYVQIAAQDESGILDIWYEGVGIKRQTNVTINICTYRREQTVLGNLEILSEAIHTDPFLREHLKVTCVDNGSTLTDVPDNVTLFSNPNYGGSGGYARGMMEANGATHFWLMDDDIQLEPATLHRAIAFITFRKKESTALAAGMFSFEEPTVQREATACFNGYTFVSNGHNLDFSSAESLLQNRIEDRTNIYGGWWSLIIPASTELPMPFFIKMDDVEYALRTHYDYVIMNGFGVWHEAFEKKGNAWTEYYTTRNTLIVQAMYPELPHSAVKMMAIRLLKALAYGEPKCMAAALQGVRDFVSGPDIFVNTLPDARHKTITEQFRAPLSQGMNRKRMLKTAVSNILHPHNWKSIVLFVHTVIQLSAYNSKSNIKHGSEWRNMRTPLFWDSYLKL